MLVDELKTFLQRSPTPFHACATMSQLLEGAEFERLDERDPWSLQPGQGYYCIRGDASIVAFRVGLDSTAKNSPYPGIRLVGAHTDSPCLKVKPVPSQLNQGYHQVGIETYGGVLLSTWFDRDLSLAGRVSGLRKGKMVHELIDFKDPVGCVPSLAIHLDRNANNDRSINPQKDMNVILHTSKKSPEFKAFLCDALAERGQNFERILDFNLSFYDVQPPATVGIHQDFIASARLDNLLSCFVGLKSLLSSGASSQTCLLVCNDHEEIGSRTQTGAQGTFLQDCLIRIVGDEAQLRRCLADSLMLSIDNAHGIHPNFAEKHDKQHGPILNQGPVLKYDANMSYATSSDASAYIQWLAEHAEQDIPLQSYVTRADMRCGSTIGPITASKLGIQTIDLGVPTFAMHSIRELAGSDDIRYLKHLVDIFFQ